MIVYIKEESLPEWDIQESKHLNKKIKLEDVGNYQRSESNNSQYQIIDSSNSATKLNKHKNLRVILETKENKTKNKNDKHSYFVCTICHIRIMNRDNIQIHCQMYSHERVSNVIVGVKFVDGVNGEHTLLHCYKICTFTCLN